MRAPTMACLALWLGLVPGPSLVLGPGLSSPAVAAERLALFDAHIHYSHDAWDSLAPAEAVAILRRAGVTRAFVSSSGDDGTLRLYAAAPDLVVPVLRPYRRRGETGSWMHDPTVPAMLEERLLAGRYAGIGEFHVHGADADLPVVQAVVALAQRHRIFLIAHSDADAVARIFARNPEARVLWAHAGFERPEVIAATLDRYPTLWADLAFRYEPAGADGIVPQWRALFERFPDRFMVGTDTYTPERWSDVGGHADWARAWLARLPPDLALRIAHGNAEALLRWSAWTE